MIESLTMAPSVGCGKHLSVLPLQNNNHNFCEIQSAPERGVNVEPSRDLHTVWFALMNSSFHRQFCRVAIFNDVTQSREVLLESTSMLLGPQPPKL